MHDGTKKGRAVVDIRGLNHTTVPDAYLMPSQADFRAPTLIFTVDCYINKLPRETNKNLPWWTSPVEKYFDEHFETKAHHMETQVKRTSVEG